MIWQKPFVKPFQPRKTPNHQFNNLSHFNTTVVYFRAVMNRA